MLKRIMAVFMVLMLLFSFSGCGAALDVLNEAVTRYLRPTGPCGPRPVPDSKFPTPSSDSGEMIFPDDSEPTEQEPIPGDELVLEVLQDEIRQSGNMAGLAFLGYVDSRSSEMDLRDYLQGSKIGIDYPFIPMSMLLMCEGQELYAIVPPSETGIVTVYASGITEWGEYADDTSTPLHVGYPGEPVVVLCNLSEIYSNVLVTVTDGSNSLDFRPMLSMEDGHLAETPGIYDFSMYPDQPDETAIRLATEKLLQLEEISMLLQQGMKLRYTDEVEWIDGENCLMFVLGTDHEDQFVREAYLGVSDDSVFIYDPVSDAWINYST